MFEFQDDRPVLCKDQISMKPCNYRASDWSFKHHINRDHTSRIYSVNIAIWIAQVTKNTASKTKISNILISNQKNSTNSSKKTAKCNFYKESKMYTIYVKPRKHNKLATHLAQNIQLSLTRVCN